MDKLYADIIILICSYLNDKKKLCFLSSNAYLHKIKNNIIFNDKHLLSKKIMSLSYYNNFTHLIFKRMPLSCLNTMPKNIKKITFGRYFNKDINDKIPDTVTHLIFGSRYTQPIRNIPLSVTHLTLNDKFYSYIPKSITHLTLGPNSTVWGLFYDGEFIPNSVQYLTLKSYFYHPIPSSVICLKITGRVYQKMKNRDELFKIENIPCIKIINY